MLKTFALRQREVPLTVYGPPGLRELFGSLRPRVRQADVPGGDGRGARRGRRSSATATGSCVFPVHHGVSAVGYAVVEDARPGRFDVEAADALGVPSGPERGALQRGESITLPDGRVAHARTRYSATRAPAGASCCRATARRPTRCACWRRAPTCSFTRRPSAKTSASAPPRRCTRRPSRRRELARAAGVRLLALTHLSTRYFGPEIAREAQDVFADTVVPRDFDVIEVPFPERGPPTLVPRGARPPREAPVASSEP